LRDTQVEQPSRLDLSRLNELIYTPKDYQLEFFKQYDRVVQQYHLKGYLLAAAPGSGKTAMALWLAECVNATRIVIISPKNALERVWVSEVIKLYKKPQTYWVAAHGKPFKNERIAIFHYETLAQALDMVDVLRSERTVVILDESHNLNETSAQRTLNFIDLVKQLDPVDCLWQSGTPIKQIGSEAIPLLRTIDPFFTADVETRFKAIYGRDGGRGSDILQNRLGMMAYKVEKHQLGLDKPQMKELKVVIPNGQQYTLGAVRIAMREFIAERLKYYKDRRKDDMRYFEECMALYEPTLRGKTEQADYKTYRRWIKGFPTLGDYREVSEAIKWVNRYELKQIVPRLPKTHQAGFKDVRSIIKYTPLKIQGEALGRVLGRLRIQCHVDMVPYIDFKGICESTPKKTVVFTSFVEVLERTKVHLAGIGMSPLVVYGKTNNELATTVKLFERQEDLNPLIATYHSLSTAVPLVMADTIVMINAPFRAYIHEQAISRIHRLGADTQTVVYECRLDTGTEPNLSTRSGDILALSQSMVEAILGITSPYVLEESPALESFEQTDPYDLLKLGLETIGITLEDEPIVRQYRAAIHGW
jgi:SNF2 family DNA or RNA helicase